MRRKVKFVDLVNGAFIQWNKLESFEVFRWMLRTGRDFQIGRQGVFECLYRLSGTGSSNYWDHHGFFKQDWRKDMQLSFVAALFDYSWVTSGVVAQWREKNGIAIDSFKMLDVGQDRSLRSEGENALEALMRVSRGEYRFKESINEYHPDATEVYSVMLSTGGDGWVAQLQYGYDGSSWSVSLAGQGPRPFAEFVIEAYQKMQSLGVVLKSDVEG